MQNQIRFSKTLLSHFATAVILLGFSIGSAQNLITRDHCPNRDNDAALGELRNQGNIGWCYANVAADLLTFRYKKELKGEKASAGYVAITFNEYTKFKANEDAGLVSPAVFFSQHHGVCPQSFQERALENSPFPEIRDQINALVELKTEYNKIRKQNGNVKDLEILKKYRSSGSYLNQISDEELTSILNRSTVRSFPRKLTDRLCQNYKVKVKPDLRIRFQLGFIEGWKNFLPNLFNKIKIEKPSLIGQADLVQEINDEITNYNITGVSYRTRIFYSPGSEAFEKSGIHASSIVGQRWNERRQRCEFKLRNSWGRTCAPYTNPLLTQDTGQCDPVTGYIYVPESLLREGISDIAYFRRAKQK